MALTERARKNHEELFPGDVSTLSVTDPELIEIFDNFAFDEVLEYGTLDIKTRLMVQLAAVIACQALGEYRVMLGAALTVGLTPIEVKEIVYQAVPYVGVAKVFDFLPRHERGPGRSRRQATAGGPVDNYSRNSHGEGLAGA
jgi:4-carboxymuconolactone decarboxylase